MQLLCQHSPDAATLEAVFSGGQPRVEEKKKKKEALSLNMSTNQ